MYYSLKKLVLSRKATEFLKIPLSKENTSIIELAKETLDEIGSKDGYLSYGLAATQLGLEKRFFVLRDYKFPENIFSVINPELISLSDEKESLPLEGCLSSPEILARINRSRSITVQYYNLESELIRENIFGVEARIFLHEYDHLQGFTMRSQAEVIFDNRKYLDLKQMEISKEKYNFLKSNFKKSKFGKRKNVER